MGKSKTPKQQKAESAANCSVFCVAILYCSLIIFLPIITFFGAKYFLFDSALQLTVVQSNIYSAIAAVVALHIALGLYLHRAYTDAESVKPATKED